MGDYRRLLAAIHNAVTKIGYEDLVLDFTDCEAAFSGPMLALCVDVISRRRSDVDFRLTLPNNVRLRNLFINAGWAHRIDPERFADSTFRGYAHVPTIQFSSPKEQNTAVNRMVDAVLCSQTQLGRPDLAAIEWALNEITDNVMNHAQSEVGGLVQLTNHKSRKRIEFVVADPGVGIRATMQQGHPDLRSDTEALDRAIREGVTRDKKVGQGNGLFGTFEIAQVGTGYLHVHSGYAGLNYSHEQLGTHSDPIPLNGTLVVAGLDVSDTDALGDALRFEGTRYEPLDYVETHFELKDREVLVVRIKEETDSFGSRRAGEPLRIKIRNLVEMNPQHLIVVDFSDVPMVSSSFADEVFGKLFVELGALRFMKALELRAMASTITTFVDRAILQRSRDEA
jgi:anti-sigma regulatory factor (Ser/Thr protein kinase)